MADNVVSLKREYSAKIFKVETVYGTFLVSGTICGSIDVATPSNGTYAFTPDELQALIVALTAARHDVLENSDPLHDPRIVD